MKYDKVNRRMFLQGSGGFLLAIPFLESLIPLTARAQVSLPLHRYIHITTPNQMHPEWISPSRSVFTSSDILIPNNPFRAKSLQEIYDQLGILSEMVSNSHEALFAKMNILRSLDLWGRLDHGQCHVHGNVAGSKDGLIIFNNGSNKVIEQAWTPTATIDNILIESGAMYGNSNSRPASLQLGQRGISATFDGSLHYAATGDAWGGRSAPRGTNVQGYIGSALPLSYNSNPKLIVENFFTNMPTPSGSGSSSGLGLGSGTGTQEQEPEFSRRKVIDHVLAEFNSVINGSKIGSHDKFTLERHFDTLSQISERFPSSSSGSSGSSGGGASCNPLNSANFSDINGIDETSSTSVSQINKYWQDITDIAVTALVCNVTRVVNLRYEASVAAQNQYRGQNVEPKLWHAEDAHMHINDNLKAHGRYALDNIFFKIATQLDAIEEVPGTGKSFLDNSLMWYCPEASYGHSSMGYAMITLGSIGGKIKTGRYIDYGDSSVQLTGTRGVKNDLHIGLPLNKWWVTVLKAWGLKPSDYENSYGNELRPSGSKGHGLYWQNRDSYESYFTDANSISIRTTQFASIGNPLPGLLVDED